jgi:hypothetical protein
MIECLAELNVRDLLKRQCAIGKVALPIYPSLRAKRSNPATKNEAGLLRRCAPRNGVAMSCHSPQNIVCPAASWQIARLAGVMS